ERTKYAVEIPYLGSLILTHSLDKQIPALKSFPPEDRPNSLIVFWSFRVMVALGLLMIAVGLWSAWLRWRGGLYTNRWFLRLVMCMGPAGLIAILAGWFTTEIGRQPWVVYGLMRTANAASRHSVEQLTITLVLFVVVYFLLFGTGFGYMMRLVRKGPKTQEGDNATELSHGYRSSTDLGRDHHLRRHDVRHHGRLRSGHRDTVPVYEGQDGPRRDDEHRRASLGRAGLADSVFALLWSGIDRGVRIAGLHLADHEDRRCVAESHARSGASAGHRNASGDGDCQPVDAVGASGHCGSLVHAAEPVLVHAGAGAGGVDHVWPVQGRGTQRQLHAVPADAGADFPGLQRLGYQLVAKHHPAFSVDLGSCIAASESRLHAGRYAVHHSVDPGLHLLELLRIPRQSDSRTRLSLAGSGSAHRMAAGHLDRQRVGAGGLRHAAAHVHDSGRHEVSLSLAFDINPLRRVFSWSGVRRRHQPGAS
nr:FAD-dependent pyridine nucleotide-disulfide oxidoreductase [Tanacetum cinerariifolium]